MMGRQPSNSSSQENRKMRIGPKIRALRRDAGLSQVQLAEKLDISASYLNLIEHNRRKVSVEILLKLADLFQMALADFASDDDSQLYTDLLDALSDDIFADIDVTTPELRELVRNAPTLGRALLHLYDVYHRARDEARSPLRQGVIGGVALLDPLGGGGAIAPTDQISDFIQGHNNYFQDLEDEADRINREIGIIQTQSQDSLVDYLRTAHDVGLAVLGPEDQPLIYRRYDPQRRRLFLSDRMDQATRQFQLAVQIGLLSAGPVIEMLLSENRIKEAKPRAIGRAALANYFAAALLMPYDGFLQQARQTRYDIDLLAHRYGASFEQVCQRLTTLNCPQNQGVTAALGEPARGKGVALHMLRVDLAGNISKRFSLSGLPIPRHGGACSRWNIYGAFLNPGVMQAQVSQLPDGSAFFCIARTVRKGGVGHDSQQRFLSIGLGCDIRYARDMVYADGLDLDRPDRFSKIGVTCRICERLDCGQRAFAPMHLSYQSDENIRGLSPYVLADQQPGKPGPTR